MKIIDYVYNNNFNSPNWIGEDPNNQFKDKEELLNWIPTAYCPARFVVDFPFYQPIKKGTDCAINKKSEKQQKILCKECWNREYHITQEENNDSELLERLKHAGKRLKELLNITDEDIERACKEARKECWK